MLRKKKDIIEQQKKELAHLQQQCIALLERIDSAHRNGKVLLLEDLDEVLVNQLMELARDDRTIILFTRDGKRIEIHDKVDEPKRRKSLF